MWCTNPLNAQQVRQEQYNDMIRQARQEALAKGCRRPLSLRTLLFWSRPLVWPTSEPAPEPQQAALSRR